MPYQHDNPQIAHNPDYCPSCMRRGLTPTGCMKCNGTGLSELGQMKRETGYYD